MIAGVLVGTLMAFIAVSLFLSQGCSRNPESLGGEAASQRLRREDSRWRRRGRVSK